jgi:hypothetical protein
MNPPRRDAKPAPTETATGSSTPASWNPGLSRSAQAALHIDAQPLAPRLSWRRETVWLEPVLEAEVSYGQIVGGQLGAPVLRQFVTELSPMRTSRLARGSVGRKQSGALLKLGGQPSQGR